MARDAHGLTPRSSFERRTNTHFMDKDAGGAPGAGLGALQMKVVLIGGGRSAHNLTGLLESAGWTIDGVVDDKPGEDVFGHTVMPLQSYAGPEWNAVLCIGTPTVRRVIVERRMVGGAFRWPRFIHPQVAISSYAQLGEGCFIAPFVTAADMILEPHVRLLSFTLVGARVRVGAYSVVSSHCALSSDVRIGRECLIGTGAKIMAGVTVGDRCQIAANAVVRKDVPDDTLYAPEGRLRTIQPR